MPGMSGREVLTRIRNSGTTTPVVICSGFSEPNVLSTFAGCEFTGFIQKPFTINDVPERIAIVLQNTAISKRPRPRAALKSPCPFP